MTDEQIFQKVIALPVESREKYMSEVCKDDAQKQRVTALLAAHEAQDSLLDTQSRVETLTGDPSRSSLPKTIGDFEILGELGRGGMGVVYEARQKSLKRKVALKVLSSGLGLSSKAILRFRREAEAAGKLHHTNIVPIYTTGEDKGVHYYAMELIDGPSLDHVVRDSKQSEEPYAALCETLSSDVTLQSADGKAATLVSGEGTAASSSTQISTTSGSSYFDQVATMMAEVADALEHAHEHGVIHRDVKPSNLLLGPDGRLSINDFGLARMLEQPGMTVSGEFVGSPLYMSPEQITAGRVALDHRTDIYSLGATLYELLTLQPPFPGQSRDQVLSQILHKEAPSTRKLNRKIPIDLDTICMKAIDKDPESRYQTAEKLAEDLRNYVNRYAIGAKRVGAFGKVSKWIRRNRTVTALASCCLLLLVVGGVLWEIDRRSDLRLAKKQTLDHILSGALVKAKNECDRAVSLWADRAWEERTLGHIALYRGEYKTARGHFDRARDFGANELPIKCLSSLLAFYQGDEAQYFAVFNSIRGLQPRSTEEKLLLGLAGVWNDPRLARKWLLSASQDEPNSPAINYSLGYAELNCAIDCVNETEAKTFLDSAVTALRRCLVDWEDNEMAQSTLLQCYLVADRMNWEVEGQAEMDRLAQQLKVGTSDGEVLLTLYWYYQQQRNNALAAKYVFGLLDESRCTNYVAAYALIQCYRLQEVGVAEKAFANIIEAPSSNKTASVPNTKRSFLELALLGTIQGDQERRKRLAAFNSYLAAKHGQGDYAHFEEDWLVLWLYGSSEQERTALITSSKAHFTHFSAPQQADLLPVLDYFLDRNEQSLLLKCKRSQSKRALANSYFAIGVIAVSEGRLQDARHAFRNCTAQNCYQFYVHQWSLAFQDVIPSVPDLNKRSNRATRPSDSR